MSDLRPLKDIWTELQMLRKRLGELERDDFAMQTLPLRDSVGTPTAALAIGQIYVSAGDAVRIRFADGAVREFTTTAVTLGADALDFSIATNSMYLGLI